MFFVVMWEVEGKQILNSGQMESARIIFRWGYGTFSHYNTYECGQEKFKELFWCTQSFAHAQ